MNIKMRDFESKILYFNGMYKLPVAPYPTVSTVLADEQRKNPPPIPGLERDQIAGRLMSFKKTLADELNEVDEIMEKLTAPPVAEGEMLYHPLDLLTDLADLLGDIQVYCASEMAKFGIPLKDTLSIIMDSNFSKLQSDGTTKYDANGKVLKGPLYWKPEPKLKEMLAYHIQNGGNHDHSV